jgi:hypothetical protein
MSTAHTKESIQELLRTNDRAVYRALLALHARQTDDEVAGATTRHTNGIGFNKFDAAWMTDMVGKFRRYGSLLPKPLAITRNKLMRYHRQLIEIANLRTSAQTEAVATTPIMPTVTPDGVNDYRPLRPRMCGCEDNDGEVLFQDCDRCMGSEFGRLEAEQERAAMLSDPDFRALRRGSW